MGWFAVDLFVFLRTSEPGLALDILPSSLLMIAAGGALGALSCRWPRSLLIGIPLLGGLSLLPAFTDVFLPEARVWLLRTAMLWCAAVATTRLLATRFGCGALRSALCLGVLASYLQLYYRNMMLVDLELIGLRDLIGPLRAFKGLLGATVVSLLLGFSRRRALRYGLTALVVALPVLQVGRRLREHRVPVRPDLPPPTAVAAPGAPNLLLIVVDTLRADHVGAYGYDLRDTTPGLDELAREHATLYTQARATSSFTLTSHASLLTGLQPSEHGSTHSTPTERPIRPEVPLLSERLRETGYQTALIAANTGYIRANLGFARGFEFFDNRQGALFARGRYLALGQLAGARPDVGHVSHRSGEHITDLALKWMERRRDAPFFLALNYLDVHSPYYPIPPFDRAFSSAQPRDSMSPSLEITPLLYDRELLYVDAEITRLLDDLKARGLFENTVVIVTSDHGESLGERGFPEHCWTLYENVLHVPLIIKPAGPRTVATIDRRVGGAEVHDIALRELGLLGADESTSREDPNVIGVWYGEDLERWIPDWADGVEPALHNNVLAWFDGPRKWIARSNGSVEAFDLGVDPLEQAPLQLDEAEYATARAWAERWWSEHPTDPFEATEPDADTLKGLRALGYAGEEVEE